MPTSKALQVRAEIEPALVTIPVAGAVLGVSVFTVRRLIERGRLTPVRFGRAVRVRRQELDRLVQELAGEASP